MQTLHQVFQLNNHGASLLCSQRPNATEMAMKCFQQAVEIALSSTSLETEEARNSPGTGLEARRAASIHDLCTYSTVPLTFASNDESLFCYDQAVYLKAEVFATCTRWNTLLLLEFFMAVTLLNTGLCLHRMANFSLACQQEARAKMLFEKCKNIYARAITLLTKNYTPHKKYSGTMLFFTLAAQNNYLLVCLQLNMVAEAEFVHATMKSFVEKAGSLLPPDAMPCAEEMALNTAILSMTDFASQLPAAAA